VRSTRPFYLGTYEVTRGEFGRFAAATRFKTDAERVKGGWRLDNTEKHSKFEGKHPYTWHKPGFSQENSHPVIDVTWDDARQFCDWLSRQEGKTYRLPTEAEWEYACRAGTTGENYSGTRREGLTQIGNVADASVSAKFSAWTAVKSSDGFVFTSPVGQFHPNNFGLYDTLGNAMEWCSDWFDQDYYKQSPESDPPGPRTGRFRIARGGGFDDLPEASGRWEFNPDHHAPDVGFRVVCEISLGAAAGEGAATVARPSAGDSRQVWLGESRFENIAAGKWRETFPKEPGHAIYFFHEVARKPEYVELFDKSRIKTKGGVSVRLEDHQALMRWGGPDQDFKPLQRGQWVTTTERRAPNSQ
jgi:sulfatase modifying factor 1